MLKGIVSARTKIDAQHGEEPFPFRGDVFVLDAITSTPGAPAAPLVDLDGRWVGLVGKIVTARQTNTFLNYAYPIEEVKAFLKDAKSGMNAATRPAVVDAPAGYHGIHLSKIAYHRQLPFVQSVASGSPAAAAGVKADDLIVSANGTAIPNGRIFNELCERLHAGDELSLIVKRGEQLPIHPLQVDGAAEMSPSPRAAQSLTAGSVRSRVLHLFRGGGAMALTLLTSATVSLAQPASQPVTSDAPDTYRLQQEVFRAAAERIAPCVVTIETIGGTQPPPAVGPQRPPGPPGPDQPPGRPGRHPGDRRPAPEPRPGFIIADGPTTGLVWSADGLILTSAFNFVRDPSVITVILPDGRRFVGQLLARDEVRRLAMVKIQASNLPVPTWVQETSTIKVGQWALALGRGFGGKDPSVSAGIVSGLNRKAGLAVQTDAKLSPANFGGPLIDLEGRVIGLCVPMGMSNSAMAGVDWYDLGIGFAVPFAQTGKSAESLAVGHNLRRGLLGVLLDPRSKHGVRIRNLADRSPATRAGLAVGDVIIALDGQPVNGYADLSRLMSAHLAGEKVSVRIKRGKDELDVPLVLGVPEDMGELPAVPLEPESEPAEAQPAESQPHGD